MRLGASSSPSCSRFLMQPRTIGIILIISAFVVIAVTYTLRHNLYVSSPPLAQYPTSGQLTRSASTTPPAQNMGGTIEIATPTANSIVESPLHISGQATESWYSEAVFQVELLDLEGTVIAEASAHAGNNQMTSGFVPFSLALTFQIPTTSSTGLLIFKKNNQSGNPSRDVIFAIPVRFK